ncbi:hypothetical protein TNCV_4217891 [Trichonephila clavipes]|nr:hypothetical protein TNCV_4217891 [Trichonephila clavipes]
MWEALNTISFSIFHTMCESGHMFAHSISNVLSCYKPPTTYWFLNLLGSRASHLLATLYPADREVTGAVPTPSFGFKVHRSRADKDQPPKCNPSNVKPEMILRQMPLLKAQHITPLKRRKGETHTLQDIPTCFSQTIRFPSKCTWTLSDLLSDLS